MCTVRRKLLDWLVKLGVRGMSQWPVVQEGWIHKGFVQK